MNLHSHSIISLVCLCRSFLITVSGCQGSLRCAFINSGLRRAGINYRRNATHFTQKTPSSQILHNSRLRGVCWVGFEGWLEGLEGVGWVFTLRCAQSRKQREETALKTRRPAAREAQTCRNSKPTQAVSWASTWNLDKYSAHLASPYRASPNRNEHARDQRARCV